jgi:glycosyltransferase involved in cell wall biosynthesis
MKTRGQQCKVAIYMDDWQCAPGSGGALRLRSNVTAFRDLGWEVEAVRLEDRALPAPAWVAPLGAVWTTESAGGAPAGAGLTGKLQFRAGFPGEAACRYFFPKHAAVREAVKRRSGQGTLHVLEGIQMANALPFLPRSEAVIFSHHDVWREATEAAFQAQVELEGREAGALERRELRFIGRLEERLGRAGRPILTISARDCAELRRQGCAQAELLPMGIAIDRPVRRTPPAGGPLRLLHVGRIAHLPSYRSLEYILAEVFPLLGAATLERIRLRVVGKAEPDNPRARRIMELSRRYAGQVELAGFVSDIDAEFANSDLQVVASTAASGLQTRIVESLAKGLAVLSSAMAAQGLESPESGKDLYIATAAREFAGVIERLTADPAEVAAMGENGRAFFERRHSRTVIAARLEELLARVLAM